MRFFLFKVHGYTFYSAPLHARSVRYLAIISIACRIRIEIGFGRKSMSWSSLSMPDNKLFSLNISWTFGSMEELTDQISMGAEGHGVRNDSSREKHLQAYTFGEEMLP